MHIKNGLKTTFIFIFLLFASTLLCNFALADDNDIYVTKIYECNFPNLFDDFSELSLIQTHTLLSIQGKPLDTETKEYVNIIVEILTTFNEVNTLSQSETPESHIEALKKAGEIETQIDELKKYDVPNERGYPLLFSIATSRYFKNEAAYFQEVAGKEKNSALRIQYLENSAIAYRNAGNFELYSELSYTADEEKQIYEKDMDIASESLQTANTFLSDSGKSRDSYSILDFFIQINKFSTGNTVKEKMKTAILLHRKHSVTQLTDTIDIYNKIFYLNIETFTKIMQYLLIISLIYATFSIYFLFSIRNWVYDMENADLGNKLLEGLSIE